MKKETIEHFDGLDIKCSSNDYLMDFEVTNPRNDNERYMHGFIKWDGCCHFYFDDGFLHLDYMCGIESHSNLLKKIYNLASRNIINWQGSM